MRSSALTNNDQGFPRPISLLSDWSLDVSTMAQKTCSRDEVLAILDSALELLCSDDEDFINEMNLNWAEEEANVSGRRPSKQ